MKYTCVNLFLLGGNVAPLVGAWIEILFLCHNLGIRRVAPLVGAWIEIMAMCEYAWCSLSLLSWERGLKYKTFFGKVGLVLSLLSWERGLKYTHIVYIYI